MGGVAVWICNTDAVALHDRALSAHLSRDERERAERFRFPHLRRRYRIARVLLRRILSRRVACDPAELPIQLHERGKPYVPGGPEFNVSSSGPWVLIGLSATEEIGIDIELLRELDDMPNLADRYFALREREQLAAMPEIERARGFFRGWARKEAVSKALGLGLHMDFRSFCVPLDSAEACSGISRSAGFPDARAWYVRPLTLVREAESAVAANAPFELSALYRVGPDLEWSEQERA